MDFSDPYVQAVLVGLAILVLVILYQEFYAPGPNSILSMIKRFVSDLTGYGAPKKPKSKKQSDYLFDAGAGPLKAGPIANMPSPSRYGSVAADMDAAFGKYDADTGAREEEEEFEGPEFFEKPVQTNSASAEKPQLAAAFVNDQGDTVPSYQPGKIKDALKPEDLLPQDKNSVWAQVNPEGSGSLQYKNFLEAGYHIGIDTIGSSKRNANRQLRPDPPNPKTNVGPWMNAVIEQDWNISKPLL